MFPRLDESARPGPLSKPGISPTPGASVRRVSRSRQGVFPTPASLSRLGAFPRPSSLSRLRVLPRLDSPPRSGALPSLGTPRDQCKVARIRSISSLICSFSILSRTIVSVSGRGRWSSSKRRDSREAWRSFRASSRAYRLMGDVTPIVIGCSTVILTTNAAMMTATYGSAAGDERHSEIRFKNSGSADFFRGKPAAC